eukprot:6194620-Pleurochrysis_carterae.AAC.4
MTVHSANAACCGSGQPRDEVALHAWIHFKPRSEGIIKYKLQGATKEARVCMLPSCACAAHRFVLLLDCRANELHVALLLDDAPLGLLLRDPFEKGGGECLAGNRPNPLRPRWRPTREFVRRLVGLIAATAAPSLASARSHAGRRLTASAQHPPVENLL